MCKIKLSMVLTCLEGQSKQGLMCSTRPSYSHHNDFQCMQQCPLFAPLAGKIQVLGRSAHTSGAIQGLHIEIK